MLTAKRELQSEPIQHLGKQNGKEIGSHGNHGATRDTKCEDHPGVVQTTPTIASVRRMLPFEFPAAESWVRGKLDDNCAEGIGERGLVAINGPGHRAEEASEFIHREMEDMSRAHILVIRQCHGGLRPLLDCVAKMSTLKSLVIEDTSVGDEEILSVSNISLTRLQHLQTLHLRFVRLSDAGAACLGAALESCARIRCLDAVQCNLSPASVAALCTNLHLVQLNLSGNALKDDGARSLLRSLSSGKCKLHSLKLDGCSLTVKAGAILSQLCGAVPSLTAISVACNNLRDQGAKKLAAALTSGAAITSIDLTLNAIGDSGAAALASALCARGGRAPRVCALRLARNRVSTVGCKALAKALAAALLCELDLSLNRSIGATGVQALTDGALAGGRALRRLDFRLVLRGVGGGDAIARTVAGAAGGGVLCDLDLAENEIQAAGACVLSAALGTGTCTLETLVLSGNSIGDAGAVALAWELGQNGAGNRWACRELRRLDVSRNGISAEGAGVLVTAMTAGSALLELAVGGNFVDEETRAALAVRVQESSTAGVDELGELGMEAVAMGLHRRLGRTSNLHVRPR